MILFLLNVYAVIIFVTYCCCRFIFAIDAAAGLLPPRHMFSLCCFFVLDGASH